MQLGAWCDRGGTWFRVWAPQRDRVEVVFAGHAAPAAHALTRQRDGTFRAYVAGIRPGSRYWYRLHGDGLFPDPASRYQPEGVEGPSQVVDPRRFAWSDRSWRGIPLAALCIYELHVGTFTPAGTFAGAARRLEALRDLGVTAVELMPLADCPGARNWGYDGVALFAPARRYGRPDDLRRFVDRAHRLGLAVLLDVVYNHLGPDGASLAAFSPYYFSARHRTPWGAAMNLDGPHGDMVRAFFIENALHWLREYHFDGLRLDATHALIDDGPRHFLADLAAAVRRDGRSPGLRRATPPLLIAEDYRNLARMLRPPPRGWGLDAVWADDLHHHLRRALAGDREGYYADFSGHMHDVAATLARGWFYRGQRTRRDRRPRGTDPRGLAPRQFVICLQNHDQVGNRALGERLHQQIEPSAYRAASALLLCAPETPLLFMGQEWAASTPFLYFTDHRRALGALITRGRRAEFKAFSAFADPRRRARIPDPQSRRTFLASRLNWREARAAPHAGVLRLYRALLRLRRREPLLQVASWRGFHVRPLDDWGVVLVRRGRGRAALVVVVALRSGGTADLSRWRSVSAAAPGRRWRVLLHTEQPRFAVDAMPLRTELSARPVLHFPRQGAAVLRLAQRSSVRGWHRPLG